MKEEKTLKILPPLLYRQFLRDSLYASNIRERNRKLFAVKIIVKKKAGEHSQVSSETWMVRAHTSSLGFL